MKKIVEEIKKRLNEKGATLSVAESCTGGKISSTITSVPGASNYYKGSVTSYYIEVKEKVLGVNSELISEHGVVSSEVAKAMAEGVKKLMQTDYSIATTGVSSPGDQDGVLEGTVWIGISGPEKTITLKKRFFGNREENISSFTSVSLVTLLNFIN